ncbi:hypothetical protein UFOVP435_22 [uncultured Caudovirales phage]|uniref:Tail tubular protein A n=1 Tax=uncultured Caudovirales phage TaxID=2100421 RepID=A0A6J5M997_9CAUD|nr:hypothetical protein UFOVP435_22 [uncultured Caudovirales phage]
MSAAAMTYDTLVNDIKVYADRADTPFLTQIPRFIMMAEIRIATEVSGLGFIQYVTSDMVPNEPVVAKPENWRETISLSIGLTVSSTAKRAWLYERSYEFCRTYAPTPTETGMPLYFADYDYEHFLIAQTPDLAYPFELAYRARPDPLSPENQTSWTTKYAPNLILYAALLETAPFLKNDARIAVFQTMYDRASAAVTAEDKKRRMQTGRD